MDGVNASLSLASAVPGLGLASASIKLGLRRVLKPLGGNTDLKWIKQAGGTISFGSGGSTQLRAILGITDFNIHAHHIIPQEFAGHPLVQKAAGIENLNSAFHMNQAKNGFKLPKAIHQKGHDIYNTTVGGKLDILNTQSPTPEIANEKLSEFMQELDGLLRNNPSLGLNQIAELIN